MTINKIAGSKVQFDVVIPVELFKKSLDEAFEKKNKEVEIPGFRKGHAPKDAFLARFGKESLYEEALNTAISETYYQAVVDNAIQVCGYPKIDIDQSKVNDTEPIHYTVTVSVTPEVELGEYKNLGIEKEKVTVLAKEVEAEINSALNRGAMLVKKADDAVIENGDTVVFDFEGFKDGVAFEGGSAKDYSLEIGSGQFIPGFEEQMVGLKSGDKKDLEVTFPEDYHAENLKGAKAVFKIEVKEIKVKETPTLDDEFVKDQKIDGVETVDAYKKHVKETIKNRKENQALEKAKNNLYMQVVKNAKFELPEDLVEEEANYSLEQAKNQAKQYGLTLEQLLQYSGGGTVEEFKNARKEQAKNTLSLRFVLKAIAEIEKFEATDEEIEAKFNEIAEQYKLTIDQVKEQVSLSAIKEEIVTTKAYDFIEKENPFVAPKSKKDE